MQQFLGSSRKPGMTTICLTLCHTSPERLVYLHLVCSCGCSAKFSEMTLEAAYGGEMNDRFNNSTGGNVGIYHRMPIAPSLKICVICSNILTKRTVLGGPFIWSSLRYASAIIMFFLDMTHLPGWWICFSKGSHFTNTFAYFFYFFFYNC